MKHLPVVALLLLLLGGGTQARVPVPQVVADTVELTWKPYRTFPTQYQGADIINSSVTVDSDGVVHVVQMTINYKIIYFNSRYETRGVNGFCDPIEIDWVTVGQNDGLAGADIFADNLGRVHIVWEHHYVTQDQFHTPYGRIGHFIQYHDGHTSNNWVTTDVVSHTYRSPEVAVSDTGVVHILAMHVGPPPVNTRPEHGISNGQPNGLTLSPLAGPISAFSNRLAVRGTNVCAIWEDVASGGVETLKYLQGVYNPQTGAVGWIGSATAIPGTNSDDEFPDVDFDINNNPHFAWYRGGSTNQVMYLGPGGGTQQVSIGTGVAGSAGFSGPVRVRAWDTKVHVFYKGISHAEKVIGPNTWYREQPIKAPNTGQIQSAGPREVSVFRGRFDVVDATHHVRTYSNLPEGASWVPALPGGSVNIVPLNGNLQYRVNLFSTKGQAPCLSLGLTYNTKHAVGSFTGASWTMDHLMTVTPGGDDESVTLTMPDGLEFNFTFDGSTYNLSDKGFGFVAGIQKIGATWKMIADGGTEYNFTNTGKLDTVIDPTTGNFLKVNYTGGRPTSIVDQLGNGGVGRPTQLIYGATNGPDARHVVQVIDPANKSYRMNYTATYNGYQLSSVVFEGHATLPTYQFEYGTNGLMSKLILPEGSANGNYGYDISYDGAGRVNRIQDPDEYYLVEGTADNAASTSQRANLKFIYNDTDPITTGVIGNGKFCTRVLSRRHSSGDSMDPQLLKPLEHSSVSVFRADRGYGVSELWDAAALMQVPGINPIIKEFEPAFFNVTKVWDRWGYLTEYEYRPIDPTAPWLTNLVTKVKKPDPFGTTNSIVETFTYSSDFYGNVTSHTTRATPTGSLTAVDRTTSYTYITGRLQDTIYPDVTRPDQVSQMGAKSTNTYGGTRQQLTQVKNAEGNSTFYSDFDPDHGLPRTITRDGAGGSELTTYDKMGNVTSTQRPQGAGNDATFPTVYGLDGLYRVATVMDPAGSITTNGYDRESRLTSVLPPAGGITITNYDKRGFVKGGTSPDGSWTQVVDANGNIRQKKSIRDGYTYTAYDRLNRPIRTTLPGTSAFQGAGGGGGVDMVILKTYEERDTNGERFSQETRVKALADRVTRTDYDHRQRPIKVTAPDNLTVTETFYDEQDQVVATQLRYNTVLQTSTLSYRDARDRIDRVRVQDKGYLEFLQGQSPSHFSDAYTIYNKVGSVVQTVDPLGNPTSSSLAHKMTNTLDSRERVTQVTDGKGVVIRQNVWGEDDLLSEVWTPDPATKAATPLVKSESRTYTARKELKTVLNRNNAGLTYTYNAIQGQVNTVVDFQGRVTSTTYYSDTQRVDTVTVASGTGTDALGFPKSRQTKSVWDKGLLQETLVWNSTPGVNAYNASYKYFYDHGDRLERFEAPMVSPEQHFYNEFGEESQLIIGSKTITHAYNSLGQRTSSTWSGAYNKTEIRQYNAIGLLEFISNAALVGGAPAPGSLSKQLLYDNWRGTLSTEIFLTGNTTWKIQTHDYDAAKNYKLMVDGQGFPHEWVYDDNNRVEQIKYKSQPVCKAFFTPGGLVDKTSLHNASGTSIAETTHRYDGLGRKVGQETVALATRQSTAAFEWVYDSLDLVTAIKANHLGVKADLQYNERRELTQEAWSGNNSGQNAPLPNPTVLGGASTSNQSLPSNEGQGKLQSALAITAVTKAYAYDPAGNRRRLTIGAAITDYTYNIASQLTNEITPTVSTVAHGYDEWGNESTRTTTPSGGSGVTETYVYNYLNLLADYQKPTVHWQYDYWPTAERYAKTNLNNSSQNELYVQRAGDVVTEYSTPTILKNTYTQGTGVDSKCARIPASGDAGRRHYLGDSVGTVSVTLTETAAVSESTLKDVWGVPFSGPTSSERYGFAQRELDSESGLSHMRARQFDPRTGRFTQTDPVLGNRALKNYAYASNDPLSNIDPMGLDDDWWSPKWWWEDIKGLVGQSSAGTLSGPAGNGTQRSKEAFKEGVARPTMTAAEIAAGGVMGRGLSTASFVTRNLVQGTFLAMEETAYRGVVEGEVPSASKFVTEAATYTAGGMAIEATIAVGQKAWSGLAQKGASKVDQLIEKFRNPFQDRPSLGPGAASIDDPAFNQGQIIYRGGDPSPSNLKPRPGEAGVSFRDSLSNPVPPPPNGPVLKPGKPYFGVDTSKLRPDSVILDGTPPGHVNVENATVEELKKAVVERGKFPQ